MNNIQKIVVKVGTSTLTHDTGMLNLRRVEAMARTLADIKNSGRQVVFVTSGAIGIGLNRLGITVRSGDMDEKQAAAAVGQVELMNLYAEMFGRYGTKVGQLLVTKTAFDAPDSREHTLATLEKLLSLGAVPVINENDTVSTYEIEFGDNDTLSAYVARLIGADLLVLLTDTDGLYDSDPRANDGARLIERVEKITEQTHALAGGAGTTRGTGGMATKIVAAEIAAAGGIDTVIASGENPEILYEILEGKPCGTRFCGGREKA
ncbi:glutamate 5-kinase [Clostridia bacterium]|nr:glutamate 5-kinase [Clostridia bacterium]